MYYVLNTLLCVFYDLQILEKLWTIGYQTPVTDEKLQQLVANVYSSIILICNYADFLLNYTERGTYGYKTYAPSRCSDR